jgi:hypothetical protein
MTSTTTRATGTPVDSAKQLSKRITLGKYF